MRGSTVVLLVIASLLAATGCSPRIAPTPVDTSDAISPGIVETSGHIEATGILMHIDDGQGLFYAIAGEQDPVLSSLPPLIAVVANPDDIDAAAHTGQTVRVVGVQDPDRSEDRGVPLLQCDSLEVLDSVQSQGSPIAESEPATATVVDVEPARDAPGFVDMAGARQLAPPGIHELPAGRSQVIGVLESDEDGWRIAPRLPEDGSEPVTAPVMLAALETFRHVPLSDLEGDYVVAEGTVSGDARPEDGRTLTTTSIDRIENVIFYGAAEAGSRPERMPDYGGKMLRGIPYRWARIEKPGLFEIGDGHVRLVGLLFREGPEGTWQVSDAMPYTSHYWMASVAYLQEGFQLEGDPESWRGTYVAIEGTRAGVIHRHGMLAGQAASAVIRVEDMEVIPIPEPADEERFH